MEINDKVLMNNDEIVTISRTEYENLQHQVEQLTAQLGAVNSAENITISNTEYEQLKQQINWLTEQLVTMNKDNYVTKSEGLNKEICEQLGMMPNEVESYHTVGAVKEIQVPSHKRKRKLSVLNEEKLPDNIETEIIEHKLKDILCPECGQEMQIIGKEVKRRLKIIPAQVKVLEDWYYTYACNDCKKNFCTILFAIITDICVMNLPFLKNKCTS